MPARSGPRDRYAPSVWRPRRASLNAIVARLRPARAALAVFFDLRVI
jgi:hypothetical protein